MKILQEDGFWFTISTCQSGMVHEGCWVNFPTRVWKLSTVCLRESARRVKLSANHAGSCWPRSWRSIDQLVRFRMKLPFFVLVCKNNSPRFPAQMLRTTSCSAVVWSQSYLPSDSLINNLIVCNKSCSFCIISGKLSNNMVKDWKFCS